jgi:3-deoxy-manno-octulosonate cytidylyltransferase (CMP-KDO synthetase)
MPPDVLPRRAGPLRFLGSSFIFEPLHYGFGNLFSTYENEARVKRRAPCETGRMRVVAVIPARLASTRLPRKMLREIAGVPLLAWVYRGVRQCPSVDDVIVATDSDEILRFCEQQGFVARMTSAAHRSGTERVHEISTTVLADVYLNIQGDEPLTRPEHLESLIAVRKGGGVEVGTLKKQAAAIDIDNAGAVKVVTDAAGRALYFSRATIPHDRDGVRPQYYKHLGFYGYRKDALDKFVLWSESSLERSERLEQLRFLENGVPIYVAETPFDTVGVDTEEDVRRVEVILRRE